MTKSVPITPELEIIFQGKKNGLDIYKSATNVITIRPGSLHIHDGFANYLFQTTEWNTIDMTSGNDSDGVAYTTSWYFITVDKDGNFYTHAGTGANTVRPSDTAYSWVDDDNTGFKHDKQGYYYSESERIIGAVYRSTDIDYIINNYDQTNEQGENANGYWKMKNDGVMECWGLGSSVDITSGSGNAWSTGNLTFTFPKEFLNANISANVMAENTDSWGGGINITSTQLDYRLNSFASRTSANPIYHAIGRWKN